MVKINAETIKRAHTPLFGKLRHSFAKLQYYKYYLKVGTIEITCIVRATGPTLLTTTVHEDVLTEFDFPHKHMATNRETLKYCTHLY